MTGRRMSRGAIGLATALVALTAASAATAGGPINPTPGDKKLGTEGGIAYVSDSGRTDDPTGTYSFAGCPKVGHKWRLIGGGVSTGAAITGIRESVPQDLSDFFDDDDTDADDYWRAAVTGPTMGTKFTSFAICAKLKGLSYNRVDVPPSLLDPTTVSDPCPGRTEPTGGGGSTGFTGNSITSMFPDGDSWTLVIDNTVPANQLASNDYICGSPKGLKTVRKSQDIPSLDSSNAVAECPGRRHVVGGGVELQFPSAGDALASYPIDDGDKGKTPDDGWRAAVQSTTTEKQRMTTYAICRK